MMPLVLEYNEDLSHGTRDMTDRRTTKRYPIELPAELLINKVQLRERTLNIGSAGLLMTCSREGLAAGMRVKVCISWPRTREKTKLMLMRRGRIVWCHSGCVAIQWKKAKSLTLTAAALGKAQARRSISRPRRQPVVLMDSGLGKIAQLGASATSVA